LSVGHYLSDSCVTRRLALPRAALPPCLADDRETLLFCDMHGHSRKKNIFMYGCENKRARNMPLYDREGYNSVVVQGRLREKVFPKILSENYPEAFCFQECSFKVQRSKDSTARVVVWRELGLANSFTLEASFAGPSEGVHEVRATRATHHTGHWSRAPAARRFVTRRASPCLSPPDLYPQVSLHRCVPPPASRPPLNRTLGLLCRAASWACQLN
jgi:hypothetical protein